MTISAGFNDSGSARVFKVRGEVVAPGASVTLATLDGPDDGIYKLNWAIATSGTKFNVHCQSRGNDNALLIDSTFGAFTSLQEPVSIKSARTTVVYENTDVVNHTVSSDVIGWLG